MKALCVIGLLLVNSVCSGQTKMADLLSFPISDDEMGIVIARNEYLTEHKFNSPWLRELDFRLRPDNLENSLTDYRLRFGILNPFEMRANRSYHKLLVGQHAFERKKTINAVLKRRYLLILESYFLLNFLDLNLAHLGRQKEIKSISMDAGANLGDLIKLEEDITKQELKIRNIEKSVKQLIPAFNSLGLDSLTKFMNDRWLSKDQMIAVLASHAKGFSLEIQSEQQKLARKESMLKIDKAEAFSNLGFVQAEYNTERGNTQDEHIRFQIGVNLPIFNTNRPKNQRKELNLIEEQIQYEQLIIQDEKNRKIQSIELKDYINDWEMLQEKKDNLSVYESMLNELGGDLKAHNRLRGYRYFLESEILRLKADIYRRYLDQLAEFGVLSDQPYKNFLSATFESFELNPIN